MPSSVARRGLLQGLARFPQQLLVTQAGDEAAFLFDMSARSQRLNDSAAQRGDS